MRSPLKTSRVLQLLTVAMLVTSLAQLLYWLYDEAHFTQQTVERQLERYALDRQVGQDLLDGGRSAQDVQTYFPALRIAGGRVLVKPEVAEGLKEKRRRRLTRYGSEGTFLLLVLAAGIGILTYSLRQPAKLLKRQANFIAAVSHEFKTPIAGIKLACETMLMRELDLANQRKLADRILSDANRLQSMVTNILDTGRVDEGRLQLNPEHHLLAKIVSPLIERRHKQGLAQDVSLRSEIEPGLHVMCDAVALSAVLDNLLANALQSVATAGGGEVLLTANGLGKQIRIDVCDDGMGFPPSMSRKLFEKFYRLGDEMRRLTKGSGLGLYIVKTFVEQSGGRVQAKSDGLGKGATFSLWLTKGVGESV